MVECNQGLNELLSVVGFILTTLGFFQVHVDDTSIFGTLWWACLDLAKFKEG